MIDSAEMSAEDLKEENEKIKPTRGRYLRGFSDFTRRLTNCVFLGRPQCHQWKYGEDTIVVKNSNRYLAACVY